MILREALPAFDAATDPAWSRRFPGHEDRLRRHAERVGAELPAAADPASHCWACGRAAPSPGRVGLAGLGWHVRLIALNHGPAERETYCPDCYSRWGWPDQTSSTAVAG